MQGKMKKKYDYLNSSFILSNIYSGLSVTFLGSSQMF